MLLDKCNQLYHLVEEEKEHPSEELEEKIRLLKEEIDRILVQDYKLNNYDTTRYSTMPKRYK